MVAACTEPRFSPEEGLDPTTDAAQTAECGEGPCLVSMPDAGDAQVAEGDAGEGSVNTATTPEQDAWIGRYATRSTMFTVDGVLQSSAELLSLVEIKADGAGLVLEEQLCLFEGGWDVFLVQGHLRFEFPPARSSAPLTFNAQAFSSDTNTFAYGYDDPPAACSGASSLPVGDKYPWLTNDCACTTSPAVPTDQRDCRLTDPENDDEPGTTLVMQVNGEPWSYFVVQQQRIRYLNGYRHDDQLFANIEAADTTNVLGCSGAPAGCPVGNPAVPCPPRHNHTEFKEITGGDFTCRRIIDQKAGLFRTPLPEFPPDCLTEL